MRKAILAFAVLLLSQLSFAKFESSFIENRKTGHRIYSSCLEKNNFTGDCPKVALYHVGNDKDVSYRIAVFDIATSFIEDCKYSKKTKSYNCKSVNEKTDKVVKVIKRVKRNNWKEISYVDNTVLENESEVIDYTEGEKGVMLIRAIGHATTSILKFLIEVPAQVLIYTMTGVYQVGEVGVNSVSRVVQNRRISKALKSMLLDQEERKIKIGDKAFQRLLEAFDSED